MNNGTRHNSPQWNRDGGPQEQPAAGPNGNGNGSRPNGAAPTMVEQTPAPSAPEALHWDALAPVVSRGAGATARPGAGLAAQGPRRTPVLVHRGPHRH